MNSPTAVPCISAWSALSAFGVGRKLFVEGFLDGQAGPHTETAGELGEAGADFLLKDFDPVRILGKKGTRTLDRMALMVIATSGMLLDEYAASIGDTRGSFGLVLGTSLGSMASIVDFTSDTFIQDRPYLVNPAAFPNTVMNGSAGHTAIWHGLRGLNSTISAGQLTGLAALRYATRMIRRGYVETLLVGCVEELSRPVACAAGRFFPANPPHEAESGPGRRVRLGEGCVIFLVDSARAAEAGGRQALAELVDFEFAVGPPRGDPAGQSRCLADAIRILLRRNQAEPADVRQVSLSCCGQSELEVAERSAIGEIFAAAGQPRLLMAARQVGNTFSALGAFELAAVLSVAESEGDTGRGQLSLITSLGLDGAAGCALIRT
jgi:3-oxoacyl-[acyl-carrier-protein] synthase II